MKTWLCQLLAGVAISVSLPDITGKGNRKKVNYIIRKTVLYLF